VTQAGGPPVEVSFERELAALFRPGMAVTGSWPLRRGSMHSLRAAHGVASQLPPFDWQNSLLSWACLPGSGPILSSAAGGRRIRGVRS